MKKIINGSLFDGRSNGVNYIINVAKNNATEIELRFDLPTNFVKAGQLHMLEHLVIGDTNRHYSAMDKRVILNGYVSDNNHMVLWGKRDSVENESMGYKTSVSNMKKSLGIVDDYLSAILKRSSDEIQYEDLKKEIGVVLAERAQRELASYHLISGASAIVTALHHSDKVIGVNLTKLTGSSSEFNLMNTSMGSVEDITNADIEYINMIRMLLFSKANLTVSLYVNTSDKLLDPIIDPDTLFKKIMNKYYKKTLGLLNNMKSGEGSLDQYSNIDLSGTYLTIMSQVIGHRKLKQYTDVKTEIKDSKDGNLLVMTLEYEVPREHFVPFNNTRDVYRTQIFAARVLHAVNRMVREKFGILYGGQTHLHEVCDACFYTRLRKVSVIATLASVDKINRTAITKFIKENVKLEIDKFLTDDEYMKNNLESYMEAMVAGFGDMHWSVLSDIRRITNYKSVVNSADVGEHRVGQLRDLTKFINNKDQYFKNLKKTVTIESVREQLIYSKEVGVDVMFIENKTV